MNRLTQHANHVYDVRNDVESKLNYFLAAAGGIILGVMLALGV